MATKDVSALIAKEFVPVKLDLDRGIGAKDIERRFIDKEAGLPWFAFLNVDGKCLIHSTRPNGSNIGHPAQSDEVAYFRTMLQTVKKNLTDNDINFLIQSLEAFNRAAGLQPTGTHY
jgi:hypothetical protein